MQNKKTIALIVGKSGSGKDTIVNTLCRDYGFTKVISYTTRPRRPSDAEDAHIFVSNEEYDRLEHLVAETTYHGNRYCATQAQVDNADLYIIDPAGVQFFLDSYHGKKDPVVIYLYIDIFTQLRRLIKRDGLKLALKRVKVDLKAFKNAASSADHVLHNKDLNTTVNKIVEILKENKVEGPKSCVS